MESEGLVDEAAKPSVKRGHLSSNLTHDLNQQQWSVPGRGKSRHRLAKTQTEDMKKSNGERV